MKPSNLTLSCALSLCGLTLSGAAYSAPSVEEMWETIKKQQAEITQLKQEQNTIDKKIEATADAVDASANTKNNWAENTFIGGYGEHHFNNVQGGNDKVDAHRYVLFISHQYSDTVKFFSEFELEHSLAGEGKPGEVELEQAYIEWQYNQNHRLSAGLFLVPVGILNETHEPETFYGTERNSVEKNIIPSTWWETGVMFSGNLAQGLTYDLAIHSGLKTSPTSSIRSGRQKSANAVANELAYTGRIKYTGVAGLELAASVQFQADMGQDATVETDSGTLMEAHAVYQTGAFSLRALYAAWDIDSTSYEASGKDTQNGYYIEPGYKVLDNLGIFARYSLWNNTAGDSSSEDSEALDVGINYWLHERVVFKMDYQAAQSDNLNDSLNIGVGWSF